MKTPTKSNKILLNKNNSLKEDKIIEETIEKYYSKEDYRKGFKSGEAMMIDLLKKALQSQKEDEIKFLRNQNKMIKIELIQAKTQKNNLALNICGALIRHNKERLNKLKEIN